MRLATIKLNHDEIAGIVTQQGFPGSFFKMADTLIGPNDEIHLPTLKEAVKTTASRTFPRSSPSASPTAISRSAASSVRTAFPWSR